jgi:hypothetical protein
VKNTPASAIDATPNEKSTIGQRRLFAQPGTHEREDVEDGWDQQGTIGLTWWTGNMFSLFSGISVVIVGLTGWVMIMTTSIKLYKEKTSSSEENGDKDGFPSQSSLDVGQ